MQIKHECKFTTVTVMSSSSAGYCMSTGTLCFLSRILLSINK